MGKEFMVAAEYSGYVFLGWAKGQFEPEKERKMPYYNMFVMSPVSSFQSDDYEACSTSLGSSFRPYRAAHLSICSCVRRLNRNSSCQKVSTR